VERGGNLLDGGAVIAVFAERGRGAPQDLRRVAALISLRFPSLNRRRGRRRLRLAAGVESPVSTTS
jgi:hypothetical protein